MTTRSELETVLIVEDDHPLAELYAQFLTSTYTVQTATNGQEALDRIGHQVDVVLLDRQMSGLSGEEVLRAIREEGYDCRVAMVTAVFPDIDIFEMDYDDYLLKPVDKTALNGLVERLLGLNDHDALVQEYYQLTTKIEALKVEQNDFGVMKNAIYERMQDRLDELDAELDQTQRLVTKSYYRKILDRSNSHSHYGKRSMSRRRDRPDG